MARVLVILLAAWCTHLSHGRVIHNANSCFADSTGQLDTIDRLAKVLLKTLVELLLSDTLVRVEFSKKCA